MIDYEPGDLYVGVPCSRCGDEAMLHCEDCGACSEMYHAPDCIYLPERSAEW